MRERIKLKQTRKSQNTTQGENQTQITIKWMNQYLSKENRYYTRYNKHRHWFAKAEETVWRILRRHTGLLSASFHRPFCPFYPSDCGECMQKPFDWRRRIEIYKTNKKIRIKRGIKVSFSSGARARIRSGQLKLARIVFHFWVWPVLWQIIVWFEWYNICENYMSGLNYRDSK